MLDGLPFSPCLQLLVWYFPVRWARMPLGNPLRTLLGLVAVTITFSITVAREDTWLQDRNFGIVFLSNAEDTWLRDLTFFEDTWLRDRPPKIPGFGTAPKIPATILRQSV